jgi:hypothetical protein
MLELVPTLVLWFVGLVLWSTGTILVTVGCAMAANALAAYIRRDGHPFGSGFWLAGSVLCLVGYWVAPYDGASSIPLLPVAAELAAIGLMAAVRVAWWLRGGS